MIKIAHVKEVNSITLPQEVITVVLEVVTILDTEYGENRDVDSGYGGYVLIVESEEDVQNLKEIDQDVGTIIPEYIEKIECNDGRVFISSLVLLGSDYGIVLIMPIQFLESVNLVIKGSE